MKRLFCFLFGCVPPPGCTKARAISFCCNRCGDLADGDLSINR